MLNISRATLPLSQHPSVATHMRNAFMFSFSVSAIDFLHNKQISTAGESFELFSFGFSCCLLCFCVSLCCPSEVLSAVEEKTEESETRTER